MGLYIKNMAMPKDCWHCKMINGADECCLLSEEQHDMYEGEMDQVRAAFCPLIEVPPHGRLGDLDALVRQFPYLNNFDTGNITMTMVAIRNRIYTAPTIIPADKDGE